MQAEDLTEDTGAHAPAEPMAPLPTSKVRALARDILEGRVFGTWDKRWQDESAVGGMTFMPLVFGGEGVLPPNTGHVYEYMDRAEPRSVNGLPIFFSMRVLPEENIQELCMWLIRGEARRALDEIWGEIGDHKYSWFTSLFATVISLPTLARLYWKANFGR